MLNLQRELRLKLLLRQLQQLPSFSSSFSFLPFLLLFSSFCLENHKHQLLHHYHWFHLNYVHLYHRNRYLQHKYLYFLLVFFHHTILHHHFHLSGPCLHHRQINYHLSLYRLSLHPHLELNQSCQALFWTCFRYWH